MNIVLTISGFLIAFLVNLLFPQVAENVRIKEYVFGGFRVDDNLAYRLVLLAIIAYYAVYTVVPCFPNEPRDVYHWCFLQGRNSKQMED